MTLSDTRIEKMCKSRGKTNVYHIRNFATIENSFFRVSNFAYFVTKALSEYSAYLRLIALMAHLSLKTSNIHCFSEIDLCTLNRFQVGKSRTVHLSVLRCPRFSFIQFSLELWMCQWHYFFTYLTFLENRNTTTYVHA